MTDVAQAEQTLASLEDTRRALITKATELADERQRVSFAAHTGDAKARQRLDAINTEHATQGSEMASIEAAITEAKSRLASARRDEALAADRAAAEQLRIKLAKFVELGSDIDEAFADVVSASNEMNELLKEINALGCASPNHAQMRVLGLLAMKTAVMQIPWAAREWEHLAPNQRKTFGGLVAGWRDMIENNIAARLGDKKAEAA